MLSAWHPLLGPSPADAIRYNPSKRGTVGACHPIVAPAGSYFEFILMEYPALIVEKCFLFQSKPDIFKLSFSINSSFECVGRAERNFV